MTVRRRRLTGDDQIRATVCLESYDEDSLLAEVRRVAVLIDTPRIPQAEFNRLAKASSSVIRKRLGTWEKALDRAGLRHRYSGAPVSTKLLVGGRQAFTDEELIQELKDVELKLGDAPVTVEVFNRHGRVNAETIRRAVRLVVEGPGNGWSSDIQSREAVLRG